MKAVFKKISEPQRPFAEWAEENGIKSDVSIQKNGVALAIKRRPALFAAIAAACVIILTLSIVLPIIFTNPLFFVNNVYGEICRERVQNAQYLPNEELIVGVSDEGKAERVSLASEDDAESLETHFTSELYDEFIDDLIIGYSFSVNSYGYYGADNPEQFTILELREAVDALFTYFPIYERWFNFSEKNIQDIPGEASNLLKIFKGHDYYLTYDEISGEISVTWTRGGYITQSLDIYSIRYFYEDGKEAFEFTAFIALDLTTALELRKVEGIPGAHSIPLSAEHEFIPFEYFYFKNVKDTSCTRYRISNNIRLGAPHFVNAFGDSYEPEYYKPYGLQREFASMTYTDSKNVSVLKAAQYPDNKWYTDVQAGQQLMNPFYDNFMLYFYGLNDGNAGIYSSQGSFADVTYTTPSPYNNDEPEHAFDLSVYPYFNAQKDANKPAPFSAGRAVAYLAQSDYFSEIMYPKNTGRAENPELALQFPGIAASVKNETLSMFVRLGFKSENKITDNFDKNYNFEESIYWEFDALTKQLIETEYAKNVKILSEAPTMLKNVQYGDVKFTIIPDDYE